MLAADQIYAVQNLEGTYVSGGPIDTLYLVGYLLFGAAAAHLSMRRLTDPHPVLVTWLGPVRMACLAAAMVTGPMLVVVGTLGERGMLVVAAGTALLSLLVLARLAGLVRMLARDIAQRRELEAQFSYQAFHDPLTGLTNRRRFIEATDAALATRSRSGTVVALFLDLDDFKNVNDSLGHAAGDALLVAVADRLRGGLRATDVVARLGGDEFGVLLTDVPDIAYPVKVSERLLARLVEPIDVDGVAIEVGASIGIAMDTPTMRTVDDLLGDADVAMYQAKALGKGRQHVFSPAAGEAEAIRSKRWTERGPTVRRHSVIGSPGSMLPGPGPV
jgi:diguanylate cyclase (GGDEF)-like protein